MVGSVGTAVGRPPRMGTAARTGTADSSRPSSPWRAGRRWSAGWSRLESYSHHRRAGYASPPEVWALSSKAGSLCTTATGSWWPAPSSGHLWHAS